MPHTIDREIIIDLRSKKVPNTSLIKVAIPHIDIATSGGITKNTAISEHMLAKISPKGLMEPNESTGSSVRPYSNEQDATDASIQQHPIINEPFNALPCNAPSSLKHTAKIRI